MSPKPIQLLATAACLLLLLNACGPKPETAGSSTSTSTSTTTTDTPRPRDPIAELTRPDSEIFAAYAGTQSCRSCHEAAYDAWKDSNHGLAERPPNLALDADTFTPPREISQGERTAKVTAKDGSYVIQPYDPRPEPTAHAVARVIGHDPLRQYLTDIGDGRFQAIDLAYDPHAQEWFSVYGDEVRVPGDWGHWTGRGMNWNSMCASCHNTRLRKHYDPGADQYATTYAEMSVGCESCHGPMKAHVDWQQQHADQPGDPTIARWDKDQTLDNCAPCHSRRSELTGEFAPGDHYADHYHLIIPDESDLYYADGQVRDEDYVFASFLSSRMHHAGVRCLDCHDPHSQQTILPGNQLCMRCHSGGYPDSPVINPLEHTHHAPDNAGFQCVGCHMPQTTYMQRHPRRDHGFTTPDPFLTVHHGIPNACNRCHTDQTPEWSLNYVNAWYGDRMDRPTRHRAVAVVNARAGAPDGWRPLVEITQGDEIPFWKAVAANLLERWAPEPTVTQTLLGLLNHEDARVRSHALDSLTDLPEPLRSSAAEQLRPLLNDPVRAVRIAAAWALRRELDMTSPTGRELGHYMNFNRDQPTGLLQLASFHLDRSQPIEAVTLLNTAVTWDPNSPAMRHEFAVALSTAGRQQEALQQMQVAAQLDPENAEFHYKVGLAWNEVGDLNRAIESMERAVDVDPNHSRAWYNLGLAYNQLEWKDEALTALIRGESADPQDPRIPYARSTILYQMGRLEEAAMAAEQALRAQPNFGPAQSLLQSLRNPRQF